MNFSQINECVQTITDEDVFEAMKEIPGYLDMTPSDFLKVYKIAFNHAVSRIRTSIKAEHIMTRAVVTVAEEAPLVEAVIKMGQYEISGLVVLKKDGAIAGVISEKDFLMRMNDSKAPSFMQVLLQCIENTGCIATSFKKQTASDIMSSPAITIVKSASIMDVASMFDRNEINRIPVVDEKKSLCGIIARSDLIQAMC